MPDEQIKFPQLGETITEGTVVKWLKSVGESVELDEPLYEISTDKVDTEVPSTVAGVLKEISIKEGETVEVGVVLGILEAIEIIEEEEEVVVEDEVEESKPAAKSKKPKASSASKKPKPASSKIEKKITSPLVRQLIRDTGINEALIIPSGVGGRVTKKDVELALAAREIAGAATTTTITTTTTSSAPPPQFRTTPAKDTSEPLSKIRKITGEHMRRSKDTSPHVLTAVEVDFENLDKVRQKHRPEFKQDLGFSLTYLPFIIRAVCDAITQYPEINSSITDEELVIHNFVNLAVAVDLSFEGLVAPVIKDADTKTLTELATDVVDLAERSRNKKLKPADLEGGTFTITNPGQYGTLMQFPIINQPQVAILSTDGVKRKPVVVTSEDGEELISIHSVGVLALAWDHRAIDGAFVAAFLDHLRLIIEARDWEIEF